MLNKINKYRKIIDKVPKLDSLESAREVLEAYHELEKFGSNELDELRFEYARAGINNPFLEKVFEYHLVQCPDCLQKTTNFKHFIDATDAYGDQVIAKAETEELLKKAENHKKMGETDEAIKLYKEALELRPGDKKIQQILLSFVDVYFDDIPKALESEKGQIVVPIDKATEITVKYPGETEWRRITTKKEIFYSLEAVSSIQHRPKLPLKFETDRLIIEIHEGEDVGHLVIRLK